MAEYKFIDVKKVSKRYVTNDIFKWKDGTLVNLLVIEINDMPYKFSKSQLEQLKSFIDNQLEYLKTHQMKKTIKQTRLKIK